MVPKNSDQWRPCGDYRAMNARTILDRYRVPHIDEFSQGLRGEHVFCTINPVRVYNQVRVAPEDICKTTITTRFRLFEFPFMSFVL